MQEAWNEIGVDVDLDNVGGELLQQRLFDGDFDMSLVAINLTPDGGQGILFTCEAAKTGFNFGAYCNQDFDSLEDQQLREFDPGSARRIMVQQQQVIGTDLPVGPIRFGVARTGYSTRDTQLPPERLRLPVEPAVRMGGFGKLIPPVPASAPVVA